MIIYPKYFFVNGGYKSDIIVEMTEKKDNKEKTEEKSAQKTTDIFSQSTVLRWKAPDYYTSEKSPYWSLLVGLVAIILSLILIFTGNYFPVIILVLAVIVTFQVAHEKPKTQEFALDKGGALIREHYYPFGELKSFWIVRHERKSILYLEPVSIFRSPIVSPLGKQSVSETRNFLLQYLPEKMEYGELLSDKLIRLFRL